MSFRTQLEEALKPFIPPVLLEGVRAFKDRFRQPVLTVAPDGWRTELAGDKHQGWSVDDVVSAERAKWDAYCRNLEGAGPLGFAHEHYDLTVTRNPSFHNVHLTYAYVLALTARKKDRVSVLDWGGSLGHYYQLGKAVLPDVALDYHVKEVPLMAAAGKELNPDVTWHDDASCLDRDYDLVMMNGSLLYLEDWAEFLQKIASSVKEYLFLFRLLVVQDSPSFVASQWIYNSQMLHLQVNQSELLAAVDRTGLRLVREFVVGDRPYIKGAPEQCEMRGWLFKREPASKA